MGMMLPLTLMSTPASRDHDEIDIRIVGDGAASIAGWRISLFDLRARLSPTHCEVRLLCDALADRATGYDQRDKLVELIELCQALGYRQVRLPRPDPIDRVPMAVMFDSAVRAVASGRTRSGPASVAVEPA